MGKEGPDLAGIEVVSDVRGWARYRRTVESR